MTLQASSLQCRSPGRRLQTRCTFADTQTRRVGKRDTELDADERSDDIDRRPLGKENVVTEVGDKKKSGANGSAELVTFITQRVP